MAQRGRSRHSVQVRKRVKLVVVTASILAGSAAFSVPAVATVARPGTAAFCRDAAVLRDGGRAFAEIARQWKALGREHPRANPRLLDAAALIDEAVISRRSVNIAKMNRAYEVVQQVCGEVPYDAELTVRVLPTGEYESRAFTARSGLIRVTLVSDDDALLVIDGVDHFLLVSDESGSSSGAVRLAPGRYIIRSLVASERVAGQEAILTVT